MTGSTRSSRGLNEELARSFGLRIRIGIGVHFGNVIVGNVGHPTLRRFTVVGDDVNIANRIESMTKELGATILVSPAIVERLDQLEASLAMAERRIARLEVSLSGARDRLAGLGIAW